MSARITARQVLRLDLPNKKMRVIHSLDGVEQSVPPDLVISAGQSLWNSFTETCPTDSAINLVLGLDAGGIIPAIAVSLASRLPYKIAWKIDLPLPNKVHFEEPDARRRSIFVYGLSTGDRVVIADDEVTTGSTLVNLITKLGMVGVQVAGVLCLAEARDGLARRRLTTLNIPLISLATF